MSHVGLTVVVDQGLDTAHDDVRGVDVEREDESGVGVDRHDETEVVGEGDACDGVGVDEEGCVVEHDTTVGLGHERVGESEVHDVLVGTHAVEMDAELALEGAVCGVVVEDVCGGGRGHRTRCRREVWGD